MKLPILFRNSAASPTVMAEPRPILRTRLVRVDDTTFRVLREDGEVFIIRRKAGLPHVDDSRKSRNNHRWWDKKITHMLCWEIANRDETKTVSNEFMGADDALKFIKSGRPMTWADPVLAGA